MKDAILVLALLAAAAMWVQWKDTQAQYEGAMEYVAGLEASAKARESRDARDGKLKEGGSDEALSDYGAAAARVLWPED